ncbi:MAG: hypothetical protein U0Y82_11145 [Thermoleophilia bacterium]
MSVIPRTRGGIAAACGGVLAAGLIGGAALAVATDPGNTTYNGCVSRQTGVLRVVTGGQCRTGEYAINWNNRGPQGPAGPAGPRGPVG